MSFEMMEKSEPFFDVDVNTSLKIAALFQEYINEDKDMPISVGIEHYDLVKG